MAIVTANITAGAYTGSELVTVSAVLANGTTIVVCRGEYVLGSGTVTSNVATIAVPPLASGDIMQASVSERGNQSGIPLVVSASPTQTTGWLDPATLVVTNADGSTTTYTVASYIATFGETPGAYFDPLTAGLSRLPADYDNRPSVELGFDVQQTMQAGTTVVRIVPRLGEGILVGWNGATPSSPTALTLTTSATVAVSVQRDDAPGVTLSRSLSVLVLPAPTAPSTPAAGDIIAASYRLLGNGFVRALVNSNKACEGLLVGYTTSWTAGISYGPQYQEVNWPGPVPSGSYTCQCRVIGETNPANYVNFIITF